MKKADWYDTPLYYDIIFDADTEKEADLLEGLMQRHSAGTTEKAKLRILEPACGSGRLIAALARRGHTVSGFDLNENMLAYTRQRLAEDSLKGRLWQDRLEDFTLPTKQPFDLAHCLVSTFKYVLDGPGATSHLRRVADALRPGGLYVLGLHLTDYANPSEDHERWAAERDGIKVTCNTHTWRADKAARTEALRTRLRVTREGKTTVQETHWKFRSYNATQLKALLRTAPAFELIACHDFTYDLAEERKLDDTYADIVLVLRKK